MFGIELMRSGLFRFVARPTRDRQVADITARALAQSLRAYVTGGLRGASLGNRFQPWAFAAYGLQPRTTGYQRQQRRAMGAVTPYASPRRMNFARLAIEIGKAANGRGQADNLIEAVAELQQRPHMRDLVRAPGGFSIRAMGTRTVRVSVSYPGARVLNKLGGRGIIYRQQFGDLTLGGGRDLRAILNRTAELYALHLLAACRDEGAQRVVAA